MDTIPGCLLYFGPHYDHCNDSECKIVESVTAGYGAPGFLPNTYADSIICKTNPGSWISTGIHLRPLLPPYRDAHRSILVEWSLPPSSKPTDDPPPRYNDMNSKEPFHLVHGTAILPQRGLLADNAQLLSLGRCVSWESPLVVSSRPSRCCHKGIPAVS